MKHSLYVRQKFGNVSFYPIKKTKWLHTDVDTDADFDLSYSIPLGILRPKDAFKCWCKVINRNSDGVFVQFKDKYGPVKLSRISNLRDDELFIPANYDERGFSYSSICFVDKIDEPLLNSPSFRGISYYASFNIAGFESDVIDIKDYPSIPWDEIAYILKLRDEIATYYIEGSEFDGCVVDQAKEGIFIRLMPRMKKPKPLRILDLNHENYRSDLEPDVKNSHLTNIDIKSYAFIPSTQLDIKKYRNCKCKIKITRTDLDDLAIYGEILCLYDDEIRKEDNLKLYTKLLCKNILILDTCVWENAKEHSLFFDILKQTAIELNFQITILSDIYTEIRNHAHSDDMAKQANSRNACRLIEEFLDLRCISIEDVALQSDLKYAKVYADATIRKFAIESAKKGRVCTIITEDRDLRIRIKGLLAKLPINQQKTVRCLSMEEIYNDTQEKAEKEIQKPRSLSHDNFADENLEYTELEREILRYSEDPELCALERSRLRKIAHKYLLKRAELVRNLPVAQQAENTKKMSMELTRIIRIQKAGQHIHSAIQEAIARMGNNDRFQLLECDQCLF